MKKQNVPRVLWGLPLCPLRSAPASFEECPVANFRTLEVMSPDDQILNQFPTNKKKTLPEAQRTQTIQSETAAKTITTFSTLCTSLSYYSSTTISMTLGDFLAQIVHLLVNLLRIVLELHKRKKGLESIMGKRPKPAPIPALTRINTFTASQWLVITITSTHLIHEVRVERPS